MQSMPGVIDHRLRCRVRSTSHDALRWTLGAGDASAETRHRGFGCLSHTNVVFWWHSCLRAAAGAVHYCVASGRARRGGGAERAWARPDAGPLREHTAQAPTAQLRPACASTFLRCAFWKARNVS
ncbi:hypothetical protein VTO73DRAFT_8822 [Trametes versicolor]